MDNSKVVDVKKNDAEVVAKIMNDFDEYLKKKQQIIPPGFSSINEINEIALYSYFFKILDYSKYNINDIEEIFNLLKQNSFNFFFVVHEFGSTKPKIFFEFLNDKIENEKKRKDIKKLVFKFLGYEFNSSEIISEVKVKEKEKEVTKKYDKEEIYHIVQYLFNEEELLRDNNIETEFLLFNKKEKEEEEEEKDEEEYKEFEKKIEIYKTCKEKYKEKYEKASELIRCIYLYYEKYSIISKLTGAPINAQQDPRIDIFLDDFNPDVIVPFIDILLDLEEIKKHKKLNDQLTLIYAIIQEDKALKNVVFNIIDFEYSADDVKIIEGYSNMFPEDLKLIEKVNNRIKFFLEKMKIFQKISDSISESILIKDEFKNNLKSIFQKDNNYSEDFLLLITKNSEEENNKLLNFLKSITDITLELKKKIEYLINLVENEILIAICNKSLIKDVNILQNIKNILTAKNDDNVEHSYKLISNVKEEKLDIISLLKNK